MPFIISKPAPQSTEVSGLNEEYRFGYFETRGGRDTQEDALAWHVLEQKDLTPSNSTNQLKPHEIGHCLWTTYQELDTKDLKSGTTAVTVIYDGKGHFITATLGDAASFAVVYDKKGQVLGVSRLNSVTHKPSETLNTAEDKRIAAAGGVIIYIGVPRVNGGLAVTRAIGDREYKPYGVCSEATIDVTDTNKIARDLKIDFSDIGIIQIINTCDGFTDGAGYDRQSKQDHEQYLFNILKTTTSPGIQQPDKLAKLLCDEAIKHGSEDNISVAIQVITNQTPPVLIGVYDGHSGTDASWTVADNICHIFKKQCALTPDQYAKQDNSIINKKAAYDRDNKNVSLEPDTD